MYVASDCYGEKLNVALRYDPRHDALDDLYTRAEHAFALFTIRHVHDAPLQPFAFVYVYSDVQCQWDLLEHEAQLAPCCQLYAFRLGRQEGVDAIPEPINLLLQPTDHVALPSQGASPEAPHRLSVTPHRRTSDRWAVQRGVSEEGTNHYGTPSASASPLVSHRFRIQEENRDEWNGRSRFGPAAMNASYRSASSPAADVSTASFSAVRSHRFRLQLLSPRRDVGAPLKTGTARLHDSYPRNSGIGKHSSPLTPVHYSHNDFAAHTLAVSPISTTESAPALHGSTTIDIPRSWYDPAAHTVNRSHATYTNSAMPSSSRRRSPPSSQYKTEPLDNGHLHHLSADSQKSMLLPSAEITHARRSAYSRVALSAHRPLPPPLLLPTSVLEAQPKHLGTPPLYPSTPSHTSVSRATSRRGSSILREERERVEQRMEMNLTDLRASLQDEERQYERSRSTVQHYRHR